MDRYNMVMEVEYVDELEESVCRITGVRDDTAGVWVRFRDAEKDKAAAVNALQAENNRLLETLRGIRDTCRCTCGEGTGMVCPRCDAVAAIGEAAAEAAREKS